MIRHAAGARPLELTDGADETTKEWLEEWLDPARSGWARHAASVEINQAHTHPVWASRDEDVLCVEVGVVHTDRHHTAREVNGARDGLLTLLRAPWMSGYLGVPQQDVRQVGCLWRELRDQVRSVKRTGGLTRSCQHPRRDDIQLSKAGDRLQFLQAPRFS